MHDIDYLVQAMTSSIAARGETLAPLMRQAGFRYVFLGIENILDEDLAFLRARREERAARGADAASATRPRRRSTCCTATACIVVGGLIVGNPSDTRESIEANLAFAREYVDWPYIQHPTPYPGTPMTRDFRERGLIVSDDVDEYDGTTAVVRSEHSTAAEIEFMRWRAERWMKLRHFWPVLVHSPMVRAAARRTRCWATRSAGAPGARCSGSKSERAASSPDTNRQHSVAAATRRPQRSQRRWRDRRRGCAMLGFVVSGQCMCCRRDVAAPGAASTNTTNGRRRGTKPGPVACSRRGCRTWARTPSK